MTCLILAAVAIAAADLPTFDTFFKDFAQKRDVIENLEARFEQENVTPEEETQASGRIMYAKPRQIMFTYEKPAGGATYLVDANNVYVFQPDARQLEIRNIQNTAEAEAFFLGFSENTEELRKAYDLALFEPEDSAFAKYGIVIRPGKDAESAPFQEVKLYLRESDYLPVRIHVINDEESRVSIKVLDIKTNLPSEQVDVRIKAPQGTKVIKEDRVVETVGPEGKSFPAKDGGR